MNVTPYVFGLIGLFLILNKEYSMGSILIMGGLLEAVFPNWGTAQGNIISVVRIGLASLFIGLIVHRFMSL